MAKTNRRLTRAARYRRYTGGPDPLAPPVDISEALDAIGEDVMAGYSPERALREYLRRGGEGRTGLDDLARRVAERRRELTSRHNLAGTLQQAKQLLDRAVLEERKQLARDITLDDGYRALAELQLDSLPPSVAAAVNELDDYRWQSSQARADFEAIKDLLGRELLDQRFAGMKRALEHATEEDRAALRRMLDDLADLLAAHRRGEDTAQQFEDFMAEHGDYFPDEPGTVDELVDSLARRAAAAQRLRNSMTQEQRDELDALAQQAFGSPDLMASLGRLDDELRALRPGEDWTGSSRMDGGVGLGLGEGTGVFADLADLDALSEQLGQSYGGSQLDDLDLDALVRQLGPDAAADVRTLKRIEQALRDSDVLKRTPDGRLTLTPKAMRRLGRSLLRDVAARLSGRPGNRDVPRAGAAGELSGATRPWTFGDTEPWDVTRTITNALTRTAADGGTPAGAVRVEIGDVEVQETEARTQACVVLLVDTSFSMALEGRWVPMKRTALALHTLVASRFRGDDLHLVGFGRYAESMEIDQLVGLDVGYDKGTNLHHALLLANRHFRKHPRAQPVLLVVTDGEPTAHLEPDGEVWFDYPPDPATIARTVRELDVSMRLGARTTFFRLGDDPALARFVDAMAHRVDGTVVAPDLEDLGAAVVDSYLDARGRPDGGTVGGFWVG